MTRQRHSESMASAVYEDCPYCKGKGMVKSALSMSVEIQRKVSEFLSCGSRATTGNRNCAFMFIPRC